MGKIRQLFGDTNEDYLLGLVFPSILEREEQEDKEDKDSRDDKRDSSNSQDREDVYDRFKGEINDLADNFKKNKDKFKSDIDFRGASGSTADFVFQNSDHPQEITKVENILKRVIKSLASRFKLPFASSEDDGISKYGSKGVDYIYFDKYEEDGGVSFGMGIGNSKDGSFNNQGQVKSDK